MIDVRSPRIEQDREYLSSLQAHTREILESALHGERDVAYLDVPMYRNFGDSLIAAGGLRYLADLGCNINYLSSYQTFRDARFEALPSTVAILLHGGGNLGGLWPDHERFRHHILTRFPNRRIIVLPQSLAFTSMEELRRNAGPYSRARNLTVLLRDSRSIALSSSFFTDVDVRYCYDLALGLPVRSTPRRANEVRILARSDIEARECDEPHLLENAEDWRASKANQRIWNRLVRLQLVLANQTDPAIPSSVARHVEYAAGLTGIYLNVRAARAQLAGAGAVATNRLHGHVLWILR